MPTKEIDMKIETPMYQMSDAAKQKAVSDRIAWLTKELVNCQRKRSRIEQLL